MKYCRIDLSKTKYDMMSSTECRFIIQQELISECFEIYRKYCKHKQFDSVMPLFAQQFQDSNTETVGYFNNYKLVAFSLIKKYDSLNAEALQFAWDYINPKLRLGIESLKNECAIYKARGFKYLYLGHAADYKSQINGYEILGKIDV